MKFIYACLLGCMSLPTMAQHIVFPLDTNSIITDGVLHTQEWQHAAIAAIAVSGTDTVYVRYQHDNMAMHFAFTGRLESANALFPEVLTDGANVGGANWVNGQWWFHVSAADCDNSGGYGVYNNCLATQPDWKGGPNFTPGMPITDTVEITIPFAKAGFNTATMDTMGIAFLVTNTATIFKLFPTAADRNQPATWAKAMFSKVPANIGVPTYAEEIVLCPNPAREQLYIDGLTIGSPVNITDATGRLCAAIVATEPKQMISLHAWSSGIYIIEVANAAGVKQYRKIQKL